MRHYLHLSCFYLETPLRMISFVLAFGLTAIPLISLRKLDATKLSPFTVIFLVSSTYLLFMFSLLQFQFIFVSLYDVRRQHRCAVMLNLMLRLSDLNSNLQIELSSASKPVTINAVNGYSEADIDDNMVEDIVKTHESKDGKLTMHPSFRMTGFNSGQSKTNANAGQTHKIVMQLTEQELRQQAAVGRRVLQSVQDTTSATALSSPPSSVFPALHRPRSAEAVRIRNKHRHRLKQFYMKHIQRQANADTTADSFYVSSTSHDASNPHLKHSHSVLSDDSLQRPSVIDLREPSASTTNRSTMAAAYDNDEEVSQQRFPRLSTRTQENFVVWAWARSLLMGFGVRYRAR
jgi:hypothetical protein